MTTQNKMVWEPLNGALYGTFNDGRKLRISLFQVGQGAYRSFGHRLCVLEGSDWKQLAKAWFRRGDIDHIPEGEVLHKGSSAARSVLVEIANHLNPEEDSP